MKSSSPVSLKSGSLQRPSSAQNAVKSKIVTGPTISSQSSVTKGINVVVVKPVTLPKNNLVSSVPVLDGNRIKHSPKTKDVKSKISTLWKSSAAGDQKEKSKSKTVCVSNEDEERKKGKEEERERLNESDGTKLNCNTDENANRMDCTDAKYLVNGDGAHHRYNQNASAPQLLLGGVCDSHSGSPSDLSGCKTGSSAERKQPTGKPVS